MLRRLIYISISLLVCISADAQGKLSLEDCVAYALSNHPDMKVAMLNEQDAHWQIKENGAIAFPQISLGINAQKLLIVPGLPAEALGFGEPGQKLKLQLENNIGGTLGLNQILFDMQYFKALKATRQFKDFVGLQTASTKERITNQVIDAYLPALAVSESVEILDKNITTQQKMMRETEATFKAGFAEQLDVDRLNLVLSTLQTQREILLRQEEILIDALKFAIGYPIKEELDLTDDIDALMAKYANINPAENLDYMNRADYQVILKARELAQTQLDAQRAAMLPKMGFGSQFSPSFQGNEKLFWIPAWGIGLNITMPIFDGGMNRAKVQRANIETLKADVQKSMITQGYDLEVESSRKQLANTQLALEDQQENEKLAQKIADVTETKYKAGVGSSFEVTQAQTALYQAQSAVISARFDYLTAIMNWRQALGTK